MVSIKNEEQIAKMRYAGKVLQHVLETLKTEIKSGITGEQLNRKAEKLILANKCQPNFKGLYGFPATICVSRNNVLVHGIPNNIPFQSGDLISVDGGCMFEGYHADAAFTVIVDNQPKNTQHELLVKVTADSLQKAIAILKPGVRIGDIGNTIQTYVENYGFFLPTDFTGHGIGEQLHEDPHIPNVGIKNSGMRLQAGMTICIEPMVQIGTDKIKFLADKWTPVSADGSYSAHFEHTILITSDGAELLA